MSSRKKAINDLKKVERRLHQKQAETEEHKQYWLDLIKDNQVLIGVAVAPIIFIAWRLRGRKANFKQVRHYMRLLIVPLITSIQTKVLTSVAKKAF